MPAARKQSTELAKAAHAATPARRRDDPVMPAYYVDAGIYSPIHVAEQWEVGPHMFQVLQHIQRAGLKPSESELVALKKARWYLQRYLHILDPEFEADPAENAGGYEVKG
ncbi:MAG TPA: hypothetical protein VGE97_06605 [Nitrososphaera sp.]|jgi:hypothetical protein